SEPGRRSVWLGRVALIPRTAQHRQRRVPPVSRIGFLPLAHQKPAAFVAHDDPRVPAGPAEALPGVGLPWLAPIVHHDDPYVYIRSPDPRDPRVRHFRVRGRSIATGPAAVV